MTDDDCTEAMCEISTCLCDRPLSDRPFRQGYEPKDESEVEDGT